MSWVRIARRDEAKFNLLTAHTFRITRRRKGKMKRGLLTRIKLSREHHVSNYYCILLNIKYGIILHNI